ncbi:MAG: class I SAM-dependent methyltransferase [Actinomycetota bacterium]|nr:class I SAM-dependent methyltransferase [Actinomycetota bacterium]
MGRSRNYEEIYRGLPWAYGQKPDPELMEAVSGLARGRVVDLGGGQGRHALELAAAGFDVEVVDSARSGLDQLATEAADRGLDVRLTCSDLASYVPPRQVSLVVAALIFHIPPRWLSLQIAERVGGRLENGGLFYLSLPGYKAETAKFARELIASAGCVERWVVKHLVTKKDRPRLPVARRNETRALGVKIAANQ